MTNPLNPLALTHELLAMNTVNPPGNERDCAEFLGSMLERVGFEIEYFEFDEKRTSLIAALHGAGGEAPICFTGHMDTVPLGNVPWRSDPFAGESDGDKLYGRGASDMKSGVAAMIAAALRIAGAPGRNAGLVLILTAGEEMGCKGAFDLARRADALKPAGAVVVGEPTANYPIIGHKGALWLTARTSGVAAHGSMPEQGDNAIYKAARAVSVIETFDFGVSPDPVIGGPTLNVGTISGGVNVNLVPDRADIGIDIRTIPGQSHDEIIRRLKSVLGEDVQLERERGAEGVVSDPDDAWVGEVFDIMAPVLGERPTPRGVTYFTDASALTPALGNPPTIILGPGEPSQAHKADEYCLISNIETAAEVYFQIAKKWCGV
ncbi:MAG: M20 family metallopeptidase [Desulfobacterales bacterium]|nr:M20 family metallopeptidase [Desulfobacterales bacterium]